MTEIDTRTGDQIIADDLLQTAIERVAAAYRLLETNEFIGDWVVAAAVDAPERTDSSRTLLLTTDSELPSYRIAGLLRLSEHNVLHGETSLTPRQPGEAD